MLLRISINAFLIEDEQKRLQVLAQYVGNMYDLNKIKYNNYVSAYSDIECYTKEGQYENTYVVYAYYQTEYKNIDTPAPSITRFYVVRDGKQEMCIFKMIPVRKLRSTWTALRR